MASSWLDSWGASWGDAWGQQVVDPNALRGTTAGGSSASATLTAIAWIAGSAAGSSTAQAYLELDGTPGDPEGDVLPAVDYSSPCSGRRWVERQRRRRRRRDEELLLAGIV